MNKDNKEKSLYISASMAILICMLSIPCFAVGLAESPWPCFGNDGRHTSQSSFIGPQSNSYRWKFRTQSSIGVTSAAIGKDGAIYIRSLDGYLYPITIYGEAKWERIRINNSNPMKINSITSSPAIGNNGRIYIGSDDYIVYAINSENGHIAKTFPTKAPVQSSPVIGQDGTIYIGSNDSVLYALNPDLTLKWKYLTGGKLISSPALSADGTVVYVGSLDGKLYAFHYDELTYDQDDPSSLLKWICPETGSMGQLWGSPAVGEDGVIYIGSKNKNIYAIYPNGEIKWYFETGGPIEGSPAIAPDGTVYIGCSDSKIYTFHPNSDGTPTQKYETHGPLKGTPVIDKEGTVFMGDEKGYIYALNPAKKNTFLWTYKTPYGIWSSPALSGDGTLYIGSTDGYLYAFGKVPPPANLKIDKKQDEKQPTFSWDTVPHATQYEMEIAPDEDFSELIMWDANIKDFTGEYIPEEALEIGDYYWRVRVIASDPDYVFPKDNEGLWAEGSQFSIDPNIKIDIVIDEDHSAGTPFKLTVTVRDDEGNIREDYDGAVEISSSDPNAELMTDPESETRHRLPFTYIFDPRTDHGSHTFYIIYKLAGEQTLSISLPRKTVIVTSENIVIKTGHINHFIVFHSKDSTVPQSKSMKIEIIAKDEFGNIITDYDGTISITSSDPYAEISDDTSKSLTSYTFNPATDKGSHIFYITYRTAGDHTLTVSDPESGIYEYSTVNVKNEDIREITQRKIMEYSEKERVARINTMLDEPLTVKVTDLSGNPINNMNVRFLIISMPDTQDPKCEPYLSNVSVKTDANGLASTSLALGCTPGTYTIRADFPDKGILYGDYVLFFVTATQLTIDTHKISEGKWELKASDEIGEYEWYINERYQGSGHSLMFDPESLYGADFAARYSVKLIDTLYDIEVKKNFDVPLYMIPGSKIFLIGGDSILLTVKGSQEDNVRYTWDILASRDDVNAVTNPGIYGSLSKGRTTSEPVNNFSPRKTPMDDPAFNPEFYIRVKVSGDLDLTGVLSICIAGPFWVIEGKIVSGRITEKGTDTVGIQNVAVRLSKYREGGGQITVNMNPVFTDQEGNYELYIPSDLIKKESITHFYLTAYKKGYLTLTNIELAVSLFDEDEPVIMDFPLGRKTIISTYTDIYKDPDGVLPDQVIIKIYADPPFTGASNEVNVALLKGRGTLSGLSFIKTEGCYSLTYTPYEDPTESFTLRMSADTSSDGNISDAHAGFDDYVASTLFSSAMKTRFTLKKSVSDEITTGGGIVGLDYAGNNFSVQFDERDINPSVTLPKIAIELKVLEYLSFYGEDIYSVENTLQSTIVYEIDAKDPDTGSKFRGFKEATFILPCIDPRKVLDVSLASLESGAYVIYFAEDSEFLDKGIGKIISSGDFIAAEEDNHISFQFDSLGVFTIYYPIKNIEISSQKSTITVGESRQYSASVFYGKKTEVCERAVHRNIRELIQWESSDPRIGTIKNGLFQAVKPGEVSITAKKFNAASPSVKIRVEPPSVVKSDDDDDLFGCFVKLL
ncbi:MAG: PQQ-binding-like beta-propeller repeat protein [bacterium]